MTFQNKPMPTRFGTCAMLFEFVLLAIPASIKPEALKPKPVHAFYDRPGKILLASDFKAASFDSAISCRNLSTGGREWSLPSQSCSGITGILMGQVVAQEGFVFFLHKTGHHKLERAARFFTIE